MLRVNPADGNNVLRGDIDLVTQNQAAYAVAADQTIGDTLTFQILPEPGSLVLFAMGSVVLLRRRRVRALFPVDAAFIITA